MDLVTFISQSTCPLATAIKLILQNPRLERCHGRLHNRYEFSIALSRNNIRIQITTNLMTNTIRLHNIGHRDLENLWAELPHEFGSPEELYSIEPFMMEQFHHYLITSTFLPSFHHYWCTNPISPTFHFRHEDDSIRIVDNRYLLFNESTQLLPMTHMGHAILLFLFQKRFQMGTSLRGTMIEDIAGRYDILWHVARPILSIRIHPHIVDYILSFLTTIKNINHL
jgi:hypothetical protein